MRVVAGEAGGRRLQAPPGSAIRPTSDRVREAVFSMLTSMGAVAGATAVDLFAGTGAMGIEALSRGAAAVTFVDSDPLALATVRANLAATGLAGDTATVVRADALAWLQGAPPFDLALVDPPYAFTGWPGLMERLAAAVAVCESAVELDLGPQWEVRRCRRYGGTVVTVAQASPARMR
jgi:16S rRNA (guanine966-N2)-methyltransferase